MSPDARTARGPNPLTLAAAAALLSLVMIVSVDPVAAGITLVAESVALAVLGPRGPATRVRLAVVVALAAPIGVFAAWAGPDGGEVLLAAGPVTVTEASLLLGGSLSLRLAALGVAGVLLAGHLDATRLGDALVQRTALPPRFVLGALAGVRLGAVLAADAEMLAMARRARGVAGPWWRTLAVAGPTAVALLALALQRARVLATAMDARGFGSGPRTAARPSPVGPVDAVVLAVTAIVLAVAVATGVAAGTWRPLLG